MTIATQQIKGVANGLFSSGTAAEQTRAEHVFCRRYIESDLTDGGTAGTAALEKIIHRAEVSGTVLKAWWGPGIAITADANNNFTSTLGKRTAGAARVTIGTVDSTVATGASDVAFVPRAYTLTAANVTYAAADVLTLDLSKAGTGVAVGAATRSAHVSVLIEEGT